MNKKPPQLDANCGGFFMAKCIVKLKQKGPGSVQNPALGSLTNRPIELMD
jgi:hypothetical protein